MHCSKKLTLVVWLLWLFLGLTHDQLIELRETIKQAGLGKQGHSRTVEENARALLHIHQYQRLGASYTTAVNAAARAEVSSTTTLYSLADEYHSSGTITPPDTSQQGRGNPDHPLHSLNTEEYGPSLQTELFMHEILCEQNTKDRYVTSITLAKLLKEKQNISVSARTVRRWLNQLGYEWREKKYVGGMKPQSKNARIRQFIMEYAAALKEEEEGKALIVYTDESFIHTTHASKKGWFHRSNPNIIANNDGKRLIILHAMTQDGLLADEDAVSTNWLSEIALTCEVVFAEIYEDGQDDSNYHNTMNGDKFVAWLRHRLLPTFEAKYPGKKMYLVMDNAAYHKPRDETWISASQQKSKHELAHQLLDMGVEQLTTSNGRVVASHLFQASMGEGGPSKEDLIAAVKKWLEEHPDHNKTVVEQLMSDAGHSIIYTPPYCPDVQPIELLWAAIKRQVASHSSANRSITETRSQTEDAFEQITKPFCNNLVKHCHDWIDAFLQTDGAEDLAQCRTLAGVMESIHLLKAANAAPYPHASHALPDQLSPIQSFPAAAAASAPSTRRSMHLRH